MDFYFLLRCFISSITAKTFTGFDCTCVTRWVFYKKQEPLTLREHLSSPPVFLVGLCCSLFWFFSVVLLCVFTFWVLCCDVRCDFCIGRWSSCLSEGSCFVCAVYFVCLWWCPTRVFVLFFFVMCDLWYQFFGIVNSWLPHRYSLTFIWE
jgi:hypothetical protein